MNFNTKENKECDIKLKFNSVEEILKFNDICLKFEDVNVDVVVEKKIYIDGKSMMGLLSVGLMRTNEVFIIADTKPKTQLKKMILNCFGKNIIRK